MKYFNLTSLLLVSGWSITQAQALAVPEDIERRSQTDSPGHGNYGRFGEEVIRYHEIRDGLFTGIDPEEWDDNGNFPQSTRLYLNLHIWTKVHKRHVYQAVPEDRDDNRKPPYPRGYCVLTITELKFARGMSPRRTREIMLMISTAISLSP